MKRIRYSKEREKIYELLCVTKSHPTAEWMHEKLKEQGESISLATVYRNLMILCEQGRAKKLDIQGDSARFDGTNPANPHYFVCKKNGKIINMKLPQFQEYTGDFYAVCSQCLKP